MPRPRLLSIPLLLAALVPLVLAAAQPPVAKVDPVSDDYYGTTVTDPYRWMESGTDPDWLPWLRAQGAHAQSVFEALPGRAGLLADVAERSGELTSVGSAELAGGRVLHEVRAAGEQDTKLMVREADGQLRVLFDPSRMDGEGEHVIDNWTAAPDGKHVLLATSLRGTEHSTLRVLQVEDGTLLPVAIPHANGLSWTGDSQGFSYLKFVGEPGTPGYFVGNEPRLHRLDDSGTDVVLARRGDGGLTAAATQFVLVVFQQGSETALAIVRDGRSEIAIYRADVEATLAGEAQWTPVAGFEDVIVDVGLVGDRLYLTSKKQASGGRVLQTSASKPDLAGAKALPLPGEPVIESILATRDGLLVRTIEGAFSGLWRVSRRGEAERIELPFDGRIAWVHGSATSTEALVAVIGWFTPNTVFQLEVGAGTMRDLALAPPPPFDTDGYQARREQVTARDGVKVPYTVVSKQGVRLAATTPVLLEAYGAYGMAALPRFNARMLAFLDRGGVYVLANVRGGGEFGRDWHYAGKAATKATTWRDAIDVAEQLVADEIGSPATLTLIGTSAGGVMLGGAVNERPDLFSGAIANVAFMNPIRYVSEQNYADIEEWGGPISDAASFRTMFDLDPYQHIREGVAYPAMLVVSGLNDPRAATFHSAKYAARVAAATSSGQPVLLRIDFDAGHGMGSSRSQLDEAWTDIYAFALWQGGHADFQPPGDTE